MIEALNTPTFMPMPGGGGMPSPLPASPTESPPADSRPAQAAAKGTIFPQDEAPPTEALDDSFLEDLEQDMNRLHNVSLKFDLHEATGRTMIKVIDRETDEVIREFPPEKVLDLAAKMEEMLGILFDQTV